MRFFKVATTITTFITLTISAAEQNKYDVTEFQNAATKAVDQAKKNGWLKNIDKPTLQETDLTLAKMLADQAVEISQASMNKHQNSQEINKQRIDLLSDSEGALFVSFSMPRKALIDSFKVAKENNLTILFRGLIKGTNHISATMKEVQKLSAVSKVEPKVGINPLRFTEFNVTGVPTIVLRDGAKHIVAPGTINVEYVKEQFQSNVDTSQLSPAGPVFDIDEVDLIEQMKAAASKIDWQAKQRKAKERFWKKYKTYQLPYSEENKQWLIDTTVRVTKDIKNGKGEILARAGEVTNPLNRFPMNLTIFVVNPYIPSQIEWVKSEINKAAGRFQVLLTHVEKDDGWNELARFRGEIGAPMFILPKQLIDKFKVEATPSKITNQNNGYVLVQQFNWSDKI